MNFLCIIEGKDLSDCSGILMQVFPACRVHTGGVLGEGIRMKSISDLKSKNKIRIQKHIARLNQQVFSGAWSHHIVRDLCV